MLHIEIDGKQLAVEEGAMVIEAAEAAGIYIPRFVTTRSCRSPPIAACA